MNRKLLLYCYDSDSEDLQDSDKRNSQRVGALLAARKIQADRIFHTPLPAYRELAHKLVKAMGSTTGIVSSADDFMDIPLLLQPGDVSTAYKRVLFIVPAQEIQTVASTYLSAFSLQVQSGVLLHLELTDTGTDIPYQVNLIEKIDPEILPDKFPYPFPDGPERRPRPAYYYRQSAVIPYHHQNGAVRILVIGSSKRKHLVVPKGIHEPGISAQESAAKESLEEAGVVGPVAAKCLGSYSYAKWGATCTVSVYAQKVQKLLPEEQWQERHRGRQWMSPEEAATNVKEAKLGPMILQLAQIVREDQ